MGDELNGVISEQYSVGKRVDVLENTLVEWGDKLKDLDDNLVHFIDEADDTFDAIRTVTEQKLKKIRKQMGTIDDTHINMIETN